MPEKLQWMVFKVKQRAKKDYFAQIGKTPSTSIPFYTFNWPYDQFSLVELAQIQTDVTFQRTYSEEIQALGEAIQQNFEDVSQGFDQPLGGSTEATDNVPESVEYALEATDNVTEDIVNASVEFAQSEADSSDQVEYADNTSGGQNNTAPTPSDRAGDFNL